MANFALARTAFEENDKILAATHEVTLRNINRGLLALTISLEREFSELQREMQALKQRR